MGAYKVSEDTKKALIQAGGELFAQFGFDAVSVRDITRRAGVKVNAISYHFGGKENFIQSVIDYVMKDSRPRVWPTIRWRTVIFLKPRTASGNW